MPSLFRRLRARLKYRHFDRDLARELEVHRAMKQDDLEASGSSAREARSEAMRSLGNVAYMREESRSVWIARWIESTLQDTRYALRQLRRFPGYSLGATLVLAIGVATSTVVFSAINATFLRPWPVEDADRLILVETLPTADGQYNTTSVGEAGYLRTHTKTVMDLATFIRGGTVIDEPRADVQSSTVTSSYFRALKINARKGRLLNDEDERPGAVPVALISHRLWQLDFQQDPNIIGRTVRTRNGLLTIVGVLEPGFEDVHRLRTDLWVPSVRTADDSIRPANIVGRLRDGVDASEARAELQALSRQFRTAHDLPLPELSVRNTKPINAPASRSDARQLILLFPAAGLLMLLVCANAGGLVLARTSARLRELAVRRALGASRGRVSRQVFAEVLVLALAAGLLGVLGSQLLPYALSERMRSDHFAPDASVFILAFLLSIAAAMIAATSALLRVRRISVSTFISRHHGTERSAARARAILIATQLAISTAVLTAAGLMTRAVVYAAEADPGFSAEGLQLYRLNTGQVFRASPGVDAAYNRWLELSERWRREVTGLAIPGLAFSSQPPLSRSISDAQIRRTTDHPSSRRMISSRSISSSYFDVLGIQLIEGRSLSDVPGADELVVSSQAAKWLWPTESAVGRRLVLKKGSEERAYSVVGVAKDVPTRTLGATEPVIYKGCGHCDVVLTRNATEAVASQVREAATRMDPLVRVDLRSVQDHLRDEGTSELRDASTAAWLIGLAALALSLIGAFGVLAYTVEERRREIGIRMALGGRGWPVALSVMATANGPAFWGIGAGIAAAALLATFLRHSVFGLTPLDPIAYALVVLVLIPPVAAAAIVPARRATRVDPAITLRHD